MNRLRYWLALCIFFQFACLAPPYVFATEASADWQQLDLGEWHGIASNGGAFDLEQDIVKQDLPLKTVEGQWLRASASTKASSPDFFVWFHVFDKADRPLTSILPTRCVIQGERKVCTNVAWIKPGGARVRVSFYSGFLPVLVEPGIVEIAKHTVRTSANETRFVDISQKISQLYYRGKEVDWKSVTAASATLLTAPSDIDPLPYAVSHLKDQLPGNYHSKIYRNVLLPIKSTDTPPEMPKCAKINGTTWRFDLPGSPAKAAAYPEFIVKAHQCFAKVKPRRWLINLTENMGGDSRLLFAALAPIFGKGPQMGFRNSEGKTFVVSLDAHAVLHDQEVMMRWKKAVPTYKGKVEFVMGASCASSCEAIAMATKGRFQLLGESSAGYTTANEAVPVSEEYSLALTSGYMVDLQGHTFTEIKPDVVLDEPKIKSLLEHGTY